MGPKACPNEEVDEVRSSLITLRHADVGQMRVFWIFATLLGG